ncbi:MAG TPA: restriction endonuclease subunit S, partial [Planctomycetaceae bacterium]|nr:restriction endonuclease subunit S [Planctomycetaceae bacterium]
DWLEAIIALPLNTFYNTGIATYIWVLSNRKPKRRKGKVQLIDATAIYTPLRKNLGKKNCELSDDQVEQITKMFLRFKETEQSKIFPNAAFGYWKIVVERPLRLRVDLSATRRKQFHKACDEAKDASLAKLVDRVAEHLGVGPHQNFNLFTDAVEADAKKHNVKLTSKRWGLLKSALAERDDQAEPVVKKVHKPGKVEPDPVSGFYPSPVDDPCLVVEYEADSSLRDTEQVPLLEEGGIEAFFEREVLPHVHDAWIDRDKTQIGYEISFTRHFYKPTPLRSLEEIKADLEVLQTEAEGLLEQIIGQDTTQ